MIPKLLQVLVLSNLTEEIVVITITITITMTIVDNEVVVLFTVEDIQILEIKLQLLAKIIELQQLLFVLPLNRTENKVLKMNVLSAPNPLFIMLFLSATINLVMCVI